MHRYIFQFVLLSCTQMTGWNHEFDELRRRFRMAKCYPVACGLVLLEMSSHGQPWTLTSGTQEMPIANASFKRKWFLIDKSSWWASSLIMKMSTCFIKQVLCVIRAGQMVVFDWRRPWSTLLARNGHSDSVLTFFYLRNLWWSIPRSYHSRVAFTIARSWCVLREYGEQTRLERRYLSESANHLQKSIL